MKKNLFAITFMVFLFVNLAAQGPVALQHNGNTTMYYTSAGFTDAYNASVDGDTIYLPGGFFSALSINKRIAVIGAGHHPDSSVLTGRTQINGTISLGPLADSTHLEGLHITGHLNYTAENNQTNRLRIIRNLIDGEIQFTGNKSTPSLHIEISGNIIRSPVQLSNTLNAVISNNIFTNRLHYVQNGSIANNIFTYQPYLGYPTYQYNNVYDCDNSVIENNVFVHGDQVFGFTYCDNSIIRKNLFTVTNIDFANNISSGNYTGVTAANILVNWTSTSFKYTDDYHLKTPQTYPGHDGTQVGIYGGLRPWKEGSVPFNPHIQTKTISDKTDAQGRIQVQIKVAAQQ
jgi:hypothetical protein